MARGRSFLRRLRLLLSLDDLELLEDEERLRFDRRRARVFRLRFFRPLDLLLRELRDCADVEDEVLPDRADAEHEASESKKRCGGRAPKHRRSFLPRRVDGRSIVCTETGSSHPSARLPSPEPARQPMA